MNTQKNCAYCGRFFVPHVKVGQRQRSCTNSACQRNRVKDQQKRWRKKNAGYFADRYKNTKSWRAAHPVYQKEWRAKKKLREIQTQITPQTPMQSVRVHLRPGLRLDEIQMQLFKVTQAGRDFWVDGALMHPPEIQT